MTQSENKENNFDELREKPEYSDFIGLVEKSSPHLKAAIQDWSKDAALLLEAGKDASEFHIEDIFNRADEKIEIKGSESCLMADLRQFKNRLSLLIGLGDCWGYWNISEVTAYLSRIADFCVTKSIEHLLYKSCTKGDLPLPPDNMNYLDYSGLVILAMGKLGAEELNYSSDIDLIIFYDISRFEQAHFKEFDQEKKWKLPKIYANIARRLVYIMEQQTIDGYVFRTDLRLRPDPSSTPPAVSIEAAEIYYSSLAQNWERAAMIRARPIASDTTVVKPLMSMLNSWIWRRNLDFAAIQDIHSIKRQINANIEMPLKVGAGQNVKLGRGGIREIEFFIATQQLIYGGKNPDLRVASTQKALEELAKAGLITGKAASDLKKAYFYLRRVEHHIQMVNDQQCHNLPHNESDCDSLALFLGYSNEREFYSELSGVLKMVEKYYAQLFSESSSLAASKSNKISGNLVFTGSDDDPDTLNTLSMLGYTETHNIAEIVRNWHKGRYRSLRYDRARQILTEIMPQLLESFGKMPEADAAFVAFDRFLSRLSMGVPFLSLLSMRPDMLEILAKILGAAPALADALSMQPTRFDMLIHLKDSDNGNLFSLENAKDELNKITSNIESYEVFLDNIRIWASEQRFLVGLDILFGTADIHTCCKAYTKIADVVLSVLYPFCLVEFQKKHGKFGGSEPKIAILALGKYGGKELLAGSDLDLVIIYEHAHNNKNIGDISDGDKPLGVNTYYNKFAQMLITAISAPTAEGRLYEVDMRLRPHGDDGALAISLKNYVKYQKNEAWYWEHMALTRARYICGSDGFQENILTSIIDIISANRDSSKLLEAVKEMRQRIDENHKATNIWQIKYWNGGIIDLEFIVQYLYIEHAHKFENVAYFGNMVEMIQILSKENIIDEAMVNNLSEAFELWLSLTALSRLIGIEALENIDENKYLQDTVMEVLGKTKAIESFKRKNPRKKTGFSDILGLLMDKSVIIKQIYNDIIVDGDSN